MGDEELDLGNAIEGGGGDDSVEGQKSKKFLSDRIARLLIYVASGIVAIILCITISVLTYRFMDRNNNSRSFPMISEEYATKPEKYAYFSLIPQIRVRTADKTAYTVFVKVELGYSEEDKDGTQTELTARVAPLTDLVRSYFSQKTAAELTADQELRIKNELKILVNNILSTEGVKDVVFTEYQVLAN